MSVLEGTSNGNDAGVTGINNNLSINTRGVGVHGKAETGEGVLGETNSLNFAAVSGFQKNAESKGAGVYGESLGGNAGVFGLAKDDGAGVSGNANGNGAGVVGINNNLSINTRGVGVHGKAETGEGVLGETNSLNFAAVSGFQKNAESKGAGVYGESLGANAGVFGNAKGNGTGLQGLSESGIGVAGKGGRLAARFEGDVEVTGDIRLTSPNADCAEDFNIAGVETVEPGTVMVITEGGALQPSQQAYDKRVVGVISGAGGYKPGIVLDRHHSQPNREPIALLGKVYCKVDASYAPIEVGDLLTTSPTLGHGMKADDPVKAFGSVIGKAMGAVREGRDMILLLVTSAIIV